MFECCKKCDSEEVWGQNVGKKRTSGQEEGSVFVERDDKRCNAKQFIYSTILNINLLISFVTKQTIHSEQFGYE